jgi:hypothetical protein
VTERGGDLTLRDTRPKNAGDARRRQGWGAGEAWMRLRMVWLGVVLLAAAAPAFAEPYLAVREGFKCSACHVNMTGGGMRTSFVSAHAKEILRYPDWFKPLTTPVDKFTGELNQYVALGADLRTSLTLIMQDQGTSGRVRNDKAFRWTLEETDISAYEGVGYLNVNLIPDLLTVYLDQRFTPSLTTREFWAMAYLPWDLYAKAGLMFLPYGLQLQDDFAFIRGGRNNSATSGFSFYVSQPAFELGWEPGPVSSAIAVSQGIENDRDVQVTGTVSAMFTDLPVTRNFFVGLSGSYNAGGSETSLVGPFLGFNLGRFTALAEADFRHDNVQLSTGGRQSVGTFMTYVEGNYLFFDWLNTKVAFDYADWDGTLPRQGSDAENRVSFGIEPFLARFVQVRAFYRVSNGIRTDFSHNQGLWSAEIHVFF